MENEKSTYTERIGNTTFIVCVKQAETAKKPIDTAFRDLCRHEALGGFFTEEKFKLEKMRKTS